MAKFPTALCCLVSVLVLCGPVGAEERTQSVAGSTVRALKPLPSVLSNPPVVMPTNKDHPLVPAMELAQEHLDYIRNNVRDYRCRLVKQERVEGVLRRHELIDVKCRRRSDVRGAAMPLSLYMIWRTPDDLLGREVLYVENRNRGDLLVRKGGNRNAFLNLWVEPTSSMAMRDNRYPITEFGFENMLARLLQVGAEELAYDDCKVKFFEQVKIEGRPSFGLEVRHDVYRDYFRFHIARIFIDRDLRVPVHFESWDWPEQPGEQPVLLERYRYRDIQLNVGLEDRDFDRLNPDYGFRKD